MAKLFSIFLVLFSLQGFGQPKGYTPVANLAAFHQQFEKTAGGIKSIHADFVQEKNISLLSEKVISKGLFWYKQNNRVRMEYTQPYSYLMVINGTDVYIKDTKKDNKISTRSNKLFQQINKLIVDCVSGKALQSTEFTTKVYENTQNYFAEMVPNQKSMQNMFNAIHITIQKKDMLVATIDMREPSGDNTIMRFNNQQLNSNVSDALFTIK